MCLQTTCWSVGTVLFYSYYITCRKRIDKLQSNVLLAVFSLHQWVFLAYLCCQLGYLLEFGTGHIVQVFVLLQVGIFGNLLVTIYCREIICVNVGITVWSYYMYSCNFVYLDIKLRIFSEEKKIKIYFIIFYQVLHNFILNVRL